MLSYNEYKPFAAGKAQVTISCLSSDTKPTDGIANGSMCIEMDTKTIYLFDEAGSQWVQFN